MIGAAVAFFVLAAACLFFAVRARWLAGRMQVRRGRTSADATPRDIAVLRSIYVVGVVVGTAMAVAFLTGAIGRGPR